MRKARPSAIAVLPTPGSPTNSGIVLRAAAQDLDRALDLLLAPDQHIDPALTRLDVEVGAIGRERLGGLALLLRFLLVRASHPSLLAQTGLLGDTMSDVIDRVEARHVLFLQEEHGVRLALREQGNQHVGAGHLLPPGRLDVDGGALDDPLETGGRFGVGRALDGEAGELVVEEVHQAGPQPLDLDGARLEHRQRVLVLGQRHQKMLEGGVFVLAGVGQRQGPPQGLLECSG